MKTEAEQLLNMNTAAVWAEENSSRRSRENALGMRLLFALALGAALAAIGGSLWLYLSGLATLRTLSAHLADKWVANPVEGAQQIVQQTHAWAWHMALVAAASGVGILVVSFSSCRWLDNRWLQRYLKTREEADLRSQRLLGHLTDSRVLEEEARKSQTELQSRLTEVSRAKSALQQELDQRRQTEKSLAQQTQQLERSKDVLEMHVQARTQELQKLQRRNELILNSAGEGICGFDLRGRVTFVNPAAARITGWRIEEVVGKSEAEVFFHAKNNGSRDTPSLLTNDNGEPLPEQIFLRQDGTHFQVEYVRSPIKESGKVVGAVVMFKDITERKLAEEKLAHKAAELARSNGELEQFAFVASHDLQEPLRKIQAFGDRLKIKCEAVQLSEGREYLDRMQSAAARMQTLINDLLTFSRIIRSSQPFTRVDLGIVAREVLIDLEHRIEKSKASVQLGKLPMLDADPLQMRQLLQNLIGNALKFQAPGALPIVKIDAQLVTRDQISEDAKFPNLPPQSSPDDKFCVLTIADNGIGFEEEYLEKIFAVFQRLHGRSEYEGTGVGLAVCRRITDRHGGLITAQSKLGEGSTFIVILPMQQPKPEPKPQGTE